MSINPILCALAVLVSLSAGDLYVSDQKAVTPLYETCNIIQRRGTACIVELSYHSREAHTERRESPSTTARPPRLGAVAPQARALRRISPPHCSETEPVGTPRHTALPRPCYERITVGVRVRCARHVHHM